MSARGIDALDLRILGVLQKDGRLSNASIADRVHLSESACRSRVKRLWRRGVITGCHAEIALKKLNPAALDVFVIVSLESDRSSDIHRFEQFVGEIPEVKSWHALLGEHDYVLHLIVPSLERHRQIVDNLRGAALRVDRFSSFVAHRGVARRPNLECLIAE